VVEHLPKHGQGPGFDPQQSKHCLWVNTYKYVVKLKNIHENDKYQISE
jgi:hypothetical protein